MSRLMLLAHAYVDLANAHDVAGSMAMFADQAVYVSAGVGMHAGRHAIGEMMTGFFTTFPDVHWTCSNWRHEPASAVSFEFHMTGHNVLSAARLDRRSCEWLFFNTNDLIRRIEVHG